MPSESAAPDAPLRRPALFDAPIRFQLTSRIAPLPWPSAPMVKTPGSVAATLLWKALLEAVPKVTITSTVAGQTLAGQIAEGTRALICELVAKSSGATPSTVLVPC